MVKAIEVLKFLVSSDFSEEILKEALFLRNEGQKELFELARKRRKDYFTENDVQVRSVIETSNICRQGCRYCSIGGKYQEINYMLNTDIMAGLMEHLYKIGRRVILLQSGENAGQNFINHTAEAISETKHKYNDLKIILCMGSLSMAQYKQLRDAGADGYILKFETSNSTLFSYCRPRDVLQKRLDNINILHDMGFEVGSGNIVGLPTQTSNDLVQDLKMIHSLPLTMNSTTIFIPAEKSEFAEQPAGDPNITLNFMALMRIMNPARLMPSTSSLKKMIPDGQYLGLMAGANTITIHDGTPDEYQKYFPIYSIQRVRPQTNEFKNILTRAKLSTKYQL